MITDLTPKLKELKNRKRQTEYINSCRNILRECLRYSNRHFVIFLNGRGGFGKDSRWGELESGNWISDDLEIFWRFLVETNLKQIKFVIMLKRGETYPKQYKNCFKLFKLDVKCVVDTHDTVNAVIGGIERECRERWGNEWNEHYEEGYRFIYALTLFRHQRYPAALCSWGLIKAPEKLLESSGIKDGDRYRALIRDNWLSFLGTKGAIRYKTGGFVWIHKDVRDKLRVGLENKYSELVKLRAECHQSIGDWYIKLFRASNDPLAAMTSIYHRLCSVEYAKANTTEAWYLKRVSLIEASVTLQVAVERILSCGYSNYASSFIDMISTTIENLTNQKRLNNLKEEAGELKEVCGSLKSEFLRGSADFHAVLEHNRQCGNFSKRKDKQQDNNNKIEVLANLYKRAVFLIGFRCYGEARSKFVELFKLFGLIEDSTEVLPYDTEELYDLVRKWTSSSRSGEELQLAIKAIRRYIFLELLIAELCRLNDNDAAAGEIWKKSEKMYTLAVELARHCKDSVFLQVINTYLRTDHGVLLANLGRYHEAYRRLNEASGYLARSLKKEDSVSWAVLNLRRAQVYLVRAEEKISKGHQRSVDGDMEVLALLNDAYLVLEHAEQHLLGQRKYVWWWTFLYELQMTLCVYLSKIKKSNGRNICEIVEKGSRHENIALACSLCDGKGRCFSRMFDKGTRLIKYDVLRYARMMELLLEFLKNNKRLISKKSSKSFQKEFVLNLNNVNRLKDVLEERKKMEQNCEEYHLFEAINTYAQKIIVEVEAFKEKF
jgi:hypothetical protein